MLAVYDVVVGLVFVGGLVFYAFWGCHTKAVRGLTANGGEYQYVPGRFIFTGRFFIRRPLRCIESKSTPTATRSAAARPTDWHRSARPTARPTTSQLATADVVPSKQ